MKAKPSTATVLG